MNNLVYGVGVNDSEYNVYKTCQVNGRTKILWICPFYKKWIHMLERCNDQKLHLKYPTYKDCQIVPEWLIFSTFKSWMETQDWEGKHLDKDLLIKGNKVYGPDTCIFLDANINTFITENNSTRGKYLIGVSFEKSSNKFVAQCWSVETKKNTKIGRYKTEQEAHQAWLSFKLKQAHILASQQTDRRVSDALIARYENYSI